METIERALHTKVVENLRSGKAVLIFGARRVGKTVLIRKIVDSFSGKMSFQFEGGHLRQGKLLAVSGGYLYCLTAILIYS